jgi:hypothetical protein
MLENRGVLMTIETIMWLLPVFFMLHDFEEIIMFKPWTGRNSAELLKRFPKLATRFLPHMERLSTSSFALAVSCMFILISAVTSVAVIFHLYSLWAGLLLVFFLHLVLHIVQFIVYDKYVPVIVTSVISSVYCIWALYYVMEGNHIDWPQAAGWGVVSIIVGVLSVLLAHRLAERFERYLKDRF